MDFKDFKDNGENFFWHIARRGLIDILLSSVFRSYDNNRLILEIGCGTGYQIPILKKWGEVEGFDINPHAVDIAIKNGFNVKVKNLENEAIGTSKFEAICLFDVLEHIRNDHEAIKKIYFSLKNNGFLFLTIPAYNFLFSDHDRAMAHHRRYNKKELICALENAGFKIVKNGYWNSFLFPCILLLRSFKKFLYFFRKKEIYQSEVSILPPLANNLLCKILMFENFLIERNINFHWGLSIFVIATKS